MLFQSVPAGVATPDPIASPGAVPRSNIIDVPPSLAAGGPVNLLLLSQDPATAVLGFELYVEIEPSSEAFLCDQLDAADRKWRLWFTAASLTAGTAQETNQRPPHGKMYCRITTAVAGASLLVGYV